MMFLLCSYFRQGLPDSTWLLPMAEGCTRFPRHSALTTNEDIINPTAAPDSTEPQTIAGQSSSGGSD
jgi:hypothetical protein